MVVYLLVALELIALLLVLSRLGRVLREVRRQRRRGQDGFESLKSGLATSMPPRLAHILSTELSIVSFAIAGHRQPPGESLEFTVHRRSNWPALVILLSLAAIPETLLVHLLVAKWSSTAAWTLTALTVYGMIWLVGDANAIRHRRTRIEGDGVRCQIGLRSSVFVPFPAIREARRWRQDDGSGEPTLTQTLLGEPNVLLHLAQPCTAILLFGGERSVCQVGMGLDEPALFLEQISRAIAEVEFDSAKEGQPSQQDSG